MPFIEVFDFDATPEQRERATGKMTEALCDAYGISPDIVSAYFFDIDSQAYAHAGLLSKKASNRRMFIKIHAFPRTVEMRRMAARSVTAATAEAYGAEPDSIAIYFFDRGPSEVSHGGVLASD